MVRGAVTALRNRKCQQLLRLFIVICVVAVAYTQLKSLLHQKNTRIPDPQSIHDEMVRAVHKQGHVDEEFGRRQAAPNGLKHNISIQREANDGYPDVRNIMKSQKNILKAKRVQYRRSEVEHIQDLVEDAYDKAKTAEFKERLSTLDPDCNRFTAGAKYNKSDEVVTVILMPHSHNDPGWLWTFDSYHAARTDQMFANLVTFLSTVKSDVPFHWSESINLLKWYRTASKSDREVLRSAITSQRVLMDHGSWSMPDEASTSIYSLVENLILGHTWINNEFDVKPEYSWANDPFGHSATIPYLLKQSGIKAIIINRIDMLLKKELREQQMLEFYWRQASNDEEDDTGDMLTHILPHALYITKESFGPNLPLAKTFDFSPVEMQYTEIVNVVTGKVSVDDSVVEERARQLSEQIHHRSAYFKHNVILSPIGDDFRYITYQEFTGVDLNWHYLKKYYEEHPHHKVKLQFGTIADYFKLIDEHVKVNEYPVLSGDFFPYADNSDSKPVDSPPSNSDNSPVYWTGYFTTRPFLKLGIRKLEVILRQTEILYSMYKLDTGDSMSSLSVPTANLSTARETLSWMLHHDAITGTSPPVTIADFMKHLDAAITNLQIFSNTVAHLLGPNGGGKSLTDEEAGSNIVDTSPHVLVSYEASMEQEVTIDSNSHKSFTLYNPLLHHVSTVAHVKLKVPAGMTDLSLADSKGQPVSCQLSPFVSSEYQVLEELLELSFVADLPSLARQSYMLTSGGEGSCQLATVRIYASSSTPLNSFKKFPMEVKTPIDKHEIDTGLNKVSVSTLNGTLLEMKSMGEDEMLRTKQTFGLYNNGDRDPNVENGIYIFTAADEGSPVAYQSKLPPLIITGKVETIVVTTLPCVTQCLRVNGVEPGVAITQLVNMGSTNGDLFTRIQSGVESDSYFYTDSNSFTMVERSIRYPERSLASNYYPITSAAFIDNDSHRLTLLSAQPLGATSLRQGDIEVMLERRHLTHDHGGVPDPLDDNRPVVMQFRLLAERVNNPETIALTTLALHNSLRSSYPVHAYMRNISSSSHSFTLPCDYHLVNMRSLDTLPFGNALADDKNSLALVLQRFATVQGKSGLGDDICQDRDEVALKLPPGYTAKKTSLSLMHTHGEVNLADISLDKPNTIQTYKISKH